MINIADILKDCPKGTKLYSPICGECRLIKIYDGLGFDVINDTDDVFNFSYDGRYNLNGECCIFPSKEQRDWSKFQRPFNDGDIVFYSNTIAIFKEWGDETLFRTYCVFYTSVKKSIFSFELDRPLFGKSVRKEIRLATEDEKIKLFDTIKANGYKWNAETKILEKLIIPKFKIGDRIKWFKNGNIYEIIKILPNYYITRYLGSDIMISFNDQDECELVPNKFDISRLKAFDKVLVRSGNSHEWKAGFFSHIDYYNNKTHFVVNTHCWTQCIPYEGNEHLVGTTNNCDEYFKNW